MVVLAATPEVFKVFDHFMYRGGAIVGLFIILGIAAYALWNVTNGD